LEQAGLRRVIHSTTSFTSIEHLLTDRRVISITFIYVKNVPFTLINHIKHKANDQPVANMWNSMMYHDNTGYHVAKIFCEHPVLSSVLVTFRAEMRSNYKTQLRIPTSGNTQFSASSFGSQNRKLNDPRSATRVHIHRSGDRNQWANRDAAQSQSWRRNDVPPPPPRYQPQIGNTPTQVATHRRGMLQNDSKVADLPPQFSLASNHHASSAGAMHSARSFTTADDRMLAEFAESREAKRSDTGSSSSDRKTDQQAKNIRAGSNNYSGGYQDGCASRSLQRRTPPPPVNSNWRSTDMSARRGFVQWQKDGRAAQVPVFTEDSPPGLGIHSAYKNAGDQQPWRSATMLFHLPSPVTSSQPSKEGSSPQANELRRQTKQNPPAPSPSPFHGGFGQDHVRPTSKPHRTFPGRSTPRFVDSQQPLINPDNSVKHSHSMPVMVHQVTQRLSAQYLRAQAEASEPGTLGRAVKTSPSIQDWVIETPVRSAFEIEQSSSPSGNALSLVNMSAVVQEDSPEKLTAKTRHLDLEQKLKWHKARVDMLEVEIDMPGSNLKMEAVLKWQKAKVRMLQIDIIAAHKEHEVARGNLAQPTDDHPPQSPRHEHHSSEWPKRANGSSVESELIEPVVDENGKICRSASKNRLDKFTHIGQKLRHRRGTFTFANQEFSGSFDARLNANVEDLLASPTSSGRYPIPLPGHTHAHPPQGRPSTGLAHGRPEATPGHIDSCTEGKYSQEHEYCGNEAHRLNSANLTGADDDVFISSRGRGYLNRQSPSIRDPSQMSYNGGTWLGNKGESGYP